jgi:hypothetical protein
MVVIYQIDLYAGDFQRLIVEEMDTVDDLLRFDGTPIGKWDPAILDEPYEENPSDKVPDIWACFGYPNVAAFNARSTKILKSTLKEAGELLPIQYRDQTLNILNVTAVENCLDLRKTKFSSDRKSIEKYAFLPERLTSSLFTLCQVKATILYAVEGLRSSNEEFKPLVEKNGLTGLFFKKIWSAK